MVKFFLVSRNESDSALLRKKISSHAQGFKEIGFRTGRPANIHQTLDPSADILVLNTADYNRTVKEFVVNSRRLGYEGPIVVLARVQPSTVEMEVLDGVVVLEKPYDPKSLMGLVRNILKQEEVSQRKYRRFEVREKAILESFETGFRSETMIHNISRGGVFVKGSVDGLKKGDLIRIHFNLNKINKERTMSARVAWVGQKEGDKDHSAGLEFVSQATVYNYLLKYALC